MNLRERARLAYLDQCEHEEMFAIDQARGALLDIIGNEALELIDCKPVGMLWKVRWYAADLIFRVDVRITEHRGEEKQSNAGMVWEEVTTAVYICRESADHPVKDLGDLGRALRNDPLGDEASA